MNRCKRIVAGMLALIVTLTLFSGCHADDYALKIGDRVITKEQYRLVAKSIKTQFMTDNDLEDTEEVWDKYIDESYTSTMQEYLDAMIQTYFITYHLYGIHFDELGLELDSGTKEQIRSNMKALEQQYGGRAAMEQTLQAQGYSYEMLEKQYEDDAKKKAVIMYYFGPDSTEYPVSNEALRAYYEEYYTKVKHVFLSTKDKESNDLSREEKESIGKKAEEIYQKALAGEDFESLIDQYNEDPGMASNPNGYVFSSDDTSYVKAFHNAAFEMQPGQIRLLQTNLGYHIMKKYPFTDEEIFSPDIEATLLENMMSEESNKILEGLKERIGVEYNNAVLLELTVKNIKTNATATDETGIIAEQLQQQLGLGQDG